MTSYLARGEKGCIVTTHVAPGTHAQQWGTRERCSNRAQRNGHTGMQGGRAHRRQMCGCRPFDSVFKLAISRTTLSSTCCSRILSRFKTFTAILCRVRSCSPTAPRGHNKRHHAGTDTGRQQLRATHTSPRRRSRSQRFCPAYMGRCAGRVWARAQPWQGSLDVRQKRPKDGSRSPRIFPPPPPLCFHKAQKWALVQYY